MGIIRIGRWLWYRNVLGIVGIEGGFGSGAWYRKVALVQEGDGCLQINGEIRLSALLQHLSFSVVCIKPHSCARCLLSMRYCAIMSFRCTRHLRPSFAQLFPNARDPYLSLACKKLNSCYISGNLWCISFYKVALDR